jgi:hypothetical protein
MTGRVRRWSSSNKFRLEGVSALNLATRAQEVVKEAKNLKYSQDVAARRVAMRQNKARVLKKRINTKVGPIKTSFEN